MTWNMHDMNLSWYVPNVDHTISGQGTAVSILDHSATTPRPKTFNIQYIYNNTHKLNSDLGDFY